MGAAADDAARLVAGLLGHVRQIVGDGASFAMFQYGGMEEGKRLAAGCAAADLPRLLARLDGALGQRTLVLLDEGMTVRLRVQASPLLRDAERGAQAVLLGLFEGVLTASRHGRFRGSVVEAGDARDLVVELRRDP